MSGDSSASKKRKALGSSPTPNTDEGFQPLLSSYNEKIRPILDVVDKLRGVFTQQNIHLPTIVVVGDQSSGKSSVIESLAGIGLPRGHNICTRVPLIVQLQHHPDPVPEFLLKFEKKSITIAEDIQICSAIEEATKEVVGDNSGISNVPLTLVVRKKGVPDITMIDLPGTTRVSLIGQPEDICEQISGIVMDHIKHEDTIILNVLSATVDFSNCESVRLSRVVDPTGQRTLAVVTRCDQATPKVLFEKVTVDRLGIGLGYICVRNRIDNETCDEARIQEATLFESHPLLSTIDKSKVGASALAKRLVEIQAAMLSKCLPDLVKRINERLQFSVSELEKLPRNLTDESSARMSIMESFCCFKKTLSKVVIRTEPDKTQSSNHVYFKTWQRRMTVELGAQLRSTTQDSQEFLANEVHMLDETGGIHTVHFPSHVVFEFLLERRMKEISNLPLSFVNKAFDQLEMVCSHVLGDNCAGYPKVYAFLKKGVLSAIEERKKALGKLVIDMIEAEKLTVFTSDPNFYDSWNRLVAANHDRLSNAMTKRMETVNLEGFGMVNVKHLFDVPKLTLDQAFEMKMRMTIYWETVIRRILDWLVLHLGLATDKLVSKDMDDKIMPQVLASDSEVKKLFDVSSSVDEKKNELEKNIMLLRGAKERFEEVMGVIRIVD